MSNKPPYAIFLDDTRDPNWMRTWMTVEVAIRSAADNRFRFQLETVEGVLTSPQDARERLIKGSVVDIAATVSMCEDVGTEVVVARSYNEFCRALKARAGALPVAVFFDHDLQDVDHLDAGTGGHAAVREQTGADAADRLVEAIAAQGLDPGQQVRCYIHTSNPAGRRRIFLALADLLWR